MPQIPSMIFYRVLLLISSLFLVSTAHAQLSYELYFDTDLNTATGCNVSLSQLGQNISGVERRLIASVDRVTLMVDSVDLAICTAGVFNPIGTLDGGYPVGLNTGTNGGDVIELAAALQQIGGNGGRAQVYAVATNATNASEDILETVDGQAGSTGIFLGFPIEVPTLSAIGFALLGIALLMVGAITFRRRKLLAGVSLIMLAGVVLAMNFVADGDIADWAGMSPIAVDPEGDASAADNSIDINALFAAVDGEMLFFRVDVVDVENTAPVATPGADTTLEDTAVTLTLMGTDLEGDPLTFAIDTPPANGTLSPITPIDATSASVDYTPDPDFNGADQFTFTVNDGQATSAAAAFDITVTAVNDAPSFTAGPDQTVLEDAGAQTVNGWATGISAGPADEAGQALTFNITANDNMALFSIQPAVAADGTLTFTPADDANGTANITLELMDDGGTANGGVDTSPTQMFVINVTAVNDAPSFTVGPDQTVLEDAGAQTVNGWATGISPGPADEAGQMLTFNITGNTDPALFAAGPAVAADGTLTYTPADDANGSADITLELMDDGGTVDGGVDTSAPQTFTINVTAVNDAPSFTAGTDQTVLEDAGAQTVNGWATGISAGPADEAGQVLSFNITANDNMALFSAQPAVAAGGTLTFTPADDATGTANITLELMDDGGTADGGVDTSPTQTFAINVTAVNDAPSFTAGPNQTVLEDAGPQTVNSWATGISPGPTDEAGQTVSFNITGNTAPGLFAAGPAVATDGTLTYTPALNANGSATISLVAMDDGGTADGGVDTSPAQSFTITVTPVNDAPLFTAGPDQTVLEDAGPQTAANWAVGINAGPADEAGQTLTFNITGNTNAGLFSVAPVVAADGTLTYTPADNANGSADITLNLMDNGGTANGGVDTSAAQMFTINVTAVNDPPVVTGEAFDTVANTQLQVAAAQSVSPSVFVSGSLLSNDSDIDGPGALMASLNTATAGAIVNVAADGTFTYVPPAGMTGTDSFTYDVTDGVATVTGMVDITFVRRIWYVDNTAAAGGLGRSSDPFDTLDEAAFAVAFSGADNETICIAFGDGTSTGQDTGFLVSNNGLQLLGEHAGCSLNIAINGNPAPTVVRAPVPSNRPLIDSAPSANAIALDGLSGSLSNVVIRGLNISADLNAVSAMTTGGRTIEATVDDNIMDASEHGINIVQGLSLGAIEASTYVLSNNSITAGINGISAVHTENSSAGTLNLAIDGNTIVNATTGAGIFLDGPTNDSGALVVTSFNGNTVTDAAVRGIDIDRVTFDAGGGTDAPGGNTSIGTIGNRVEGDGMRMNQVLGGVAFGTLDIFNNNGTGWFVRDAGSKGAGTFALSTTGGTADTTNGTALNIDPVMVDLTFASVTSTNANGQGSSNAAGGGIFMNVTDAQGGASANALTVGTFNVSASNGNALTILNSVGVFTFGTTIIDNLTVPSSGGAVNMAATNGDNSTLNFTNGLDIDMFDGGDPVGLPPGSRAIQVEAFGSGRVTLSIAQTANDESILIADSAGGFIEMTAEFTTGSGRVDVGPAGIHFDSLQATGTASDEELTDDGAIRMIEVDGAGNTFNVDMLDIVDGSNTSTGITIDNSPVTYTFGSYNHQNGELNQTTPVVLTGDNGPVTFSNVNLGDNPGNPGAFIGQPFRISNNNNPVMILGGEIVAGSTTVGIQLLNQDSSGSLTVTNTNITTTLANGGGDVLQVNGGGGTVTVNGGTFATSTNSDGVDIQDTSATINIGADIVHTGVEAGGIVPTLIEIDNTTGNITFTGSMTNSNDGSLILIGLNGGIGPPGTGPTSGTVAFNGTPLTSSVNTDGISINGVGAGAVVEFSAGTTVTITDSAVAGINLTNNAGNVNFNGTTDIDTPALDGITLLNNTGTMTFNGGTINDAGADAVNCNSSVLDSNNVVFIANNGDTVETTACTLSGTGNATGNPPASEPLMCNDGGGNTGQISFNGGSEFCPP